MLTRKIFFLYIFLIIASYGYGQSPFDSLRTSFFKQNIDSLKLKTANILASKYAFVNPDSAQYFGEIAIKIATELSNDWELAGANLNVGIAYHVRGRFEEAIDQYQRSLALRIKLNDSTGISGLYNNMGAAYNSVGNFPRALEILQKSFDIKTRLGQLDKSVTTLANIGNIYFEQKKYDQALHYYHRSLEISREIRDTPGIIRALNNIGLTYLSLKKPAEGLKYYEESLALHDDQSNPCLKVYVLDGLATAYFELNQFDQAKLYVEEELALSKKCEDAEKEISSLTVLGKVNLGDNNISKGVYLLENAIEKARLQDFKANVVDLAWTLYQHYKKQNNANESLKYLEIYSATSDSLQNREMIEQLTKVELEYLFQQERDSIAFEQVMAETNFQNRIKQEKTLQYGLIAGLIIVALFALLLFMFYKDKSRHNYLLAAKNQQITEALSEREVLMREIHHRVKNNLQVVSSLLNVQSKLSTHPDAQQALAEGRDRVLTMAMIHQKLYRSESLNSIDLEQYLIEISESVVQSHTAVGREIELKVIIDQVNLDLDKVINIGLLVNELITNSLKHAFAHQDRGTIKISLEAKDSMVVLSVSDDGQHVQKDDSKQSYGTRLIATLARGLDARLEVVTNKGTQTIIKIPVS